ncbi:MAG: zinc-ribbon domain-containing protein [Deltaproteobacteria bacterium]|nr:zinc-ribbon domain-containing protein [Deltaproteobacteria bacterium]
MEVTCSHCSKALKIPDEKLPRDQIVKIACPSCRSKITIDTRVDPAGESGAAVSEGPPEDQSGGRSAGEELDYGDDTSLGFYEEGTRLAFVLDSDLARKERIRTAVEALEYRFVDSQNTRDAISKMRFHVFDLVILAEGFDGQPLEHSPIINSINHLPMSVRRKIFLALLGEQFQTMDNMMAFAMSANLVVSPGDVDKLQAVLKKAVSENDRFYKVFMDTLKDLGRA